MSCRRATGQSGTTLPEGSGETLREFLDSFSYGSRTDLAFKFLSKVSDSEGADFLQELLRLLGETIDDGDATRLVDHAYRGQVAAYAPEEGTARTWVYDDAPWADLGTPLADARVALFSSSGHFRAGDDPAPFGEAGMTQAEAVARISDFLRAAPQLSEIPLATADRDLHVRHGGYDVRAAERDPGVAFPLAALRALAAAGEVGEAADPAYSFVGAASQRRLLTESAPQWAELMQERGVDAVVLVPV